MKLWRLILLCLGLGVQAEMAYMGSQQIQQIQQGLEEAGFKGKGWSSAACVYGGADIGTWANPTSRVWSTFDTNWKQKPGESVLLQVVVYYQKVPWSSNLQYQQLVQAICNLRTRTQVPLYVSGLADQPKCPIHGAWGASVSQALAQKVVKEKGVELKLKPGPTFRQLSPAYVGKDCRLQPLGRAMAAGQMVMHFRWTKAPGAMTTNVLYDVDLTPGTGEDLHQ